jgi:hypothetical protein
MIARSLLAAAVTLSLLAAGCRKATVESYRIPKEKDPEMPLAMGPGAGGAPAATAPDSAAAGAGSMAGTAVPTADGPGLTWTAPAAWQPKPASPMRKGSYAVPGTGTGEGDLSITAFPGDVEKGGLGGELANVNRWRAQVQLPPVGDADLPALVQRVEHNGLTFRIVDFTGPGDGAQRMIGAYVPYGDATWFIKLAGPATVVGAAKPQFLAFLETVKPAAPTAQ